MSHPPHVVLEPVTRVAPFGLGLWDPATGRLVSDGLAVRVFPLVGGTALQPATARPNRRGVFVAQEVPGLRTFETGAGDDAFWATVSPRPFLVEVRDTLGRFTPFVMHVDLPVRGLVVPPCIAELGPANLPLSPPSAPAYVPLFGTPSRVPPAGMAVVRATLRDDTGRVAVMAVLEVHESGRLVARGVADEQGEVAAVFPYPELSAPPPSSPPGGAAGPRLLTEQTWSLEIAVRYRLDLPRYVPDPKDAREPARPALADLCELLQQPPATLLATTSPPVPLSEATLRYGEELVLGADIGATLFIRPV